jgi:hypothetical protein
MNSIFSETQEHTTVVTPVSAKPFTRRGIVRFVWLIALMVIGLLAVNGHLTFEAQESAPQQAAAAAWACFQIIVPYLIARAIQEVLAE